MQHTGTFQNVRTSAGDRNPAGPRRSFVRWRNVPVPKPNLFGIAGGLLLHRVRPWALPRPRYLRRAVGWPVIAAGVYTVAQSLDAAGSVDLGEPDRLVTTGPYAFSRNPMYVGWALLHLGAGLALGSGWVLAAWPGACLLIHLGVRNEERELQLSFGEGYTRYRATVPRYLPCRVAAVGHR